MRGDRVTRRCPICNGLTPTNVHKYCPECAPEGYKRMRQQQVKRYRKKAQSDSIRTALTEQAALRVSKPAKKPARKILLSDEQQRQIDSAAPRNIDRPLLDPRNRFLVRGAEWLWGGV